MIVYFWAVIILTENHLEKIADYIVFIHKGKVFFEKSKDELTEQYGIIKCGTAQFNALDKSDIVSYHKMDYEWQILISFWLSILYLLFLLSGFLSRTRLR